MKSYFLGQETRNLYSILAKWGKEDTVFTCPSARNHKFYLPVATGQAPMSSLVFTLTRDLPRQESGSHLDSQTPDFWQNDTQFYFVGFSVFVKSLEGNISKVSHIKTLNAVEKHSLFCYVNI